MRLVQQLIKSEGWIGLRDGYINESARDVSVDLQENNLIIEVTFSWYCPTLFFFKIAQNFNVNVKILEFVEGQHTIISHFNDNKDCIDVLNNHENILNNQLFRNLSISYFFKFFLEAFKFNFSITIVCHINPNELRLVL